MGALLPLRLLDHADNLSQRRHADFGRFKRDEALPVNRRADDSVANLLFYR